MTTTRAPLTRDRIIEAAVAFADEHGIEALSMRKLGHELGVEAMSLYNHVDGKDGILDGMVDWVFSQIEIPEPGGDWKDRSRAIAASAKEVFIAHEWSVALMTSRDAIGPGMVRLMDSVVGTLLDAGFDIETTHHAWHVLSSHTMGYAFQEAAAAWGGGEEHDHDAAEAELRHYAERMPNVAALLPYLHQCSNDEEFAFGLEIILNGIEALHPDVRR